MSLDTIIMTDATHSFLGRSPASQIEEAFPRSVGVLTDRFIESHPDLSTLDAAFDLLVLVPAYMAWCARNADRPEELVHDYTLRALAEFGRTKNSEIAHLNFKHRCSSAQRHIVVEYLKWCLDPDLLLDCQQVRRSLKQWSSAEDWPPEKATDVESRASSNRRKHDRI